MNFTDVVEENRHNAKCAAAIATLKIFMKDAKEQLKTSIPLSTLELIVGTVDDVPQSGIYYDNCNEIAYREGRS